MRRYTDCQQPEMFHFIVIREMQDENHCTACPSEQLTWKTQTNSDHSNSGKTGSLTRQWSKNKILETVWGTVYPVLYKLTDNYHMT